MYDVCTAAHLYTLRIAEADAFYNGRSSGGNGWSCAGGCYWHACTPYHARRNIKYFSQWNRILLIHLSPLTGI